MCFPVEGLFGGLPLGSAPMTESVPESDCKWMVVIVKMINVYQAMNCLCRSDMKTFNMFVSPKI